MSSCNKLVLIEATCEKYDNGLWSKFENNKKISINYSIGNFVLINNEIYILTCYHGIDNFTDINIIVQSEKYSVACMATLPEYDIALLKLNCTNDLKNIDCYKITDINQLIDNYECTLSSFKLDLDIFHKKIQATHVSYNVHCNNIEIESPVSAYSPQAIYISFPCEMIYNQEEIDISGLSGSLLLEKNNNSIIGMIVSTINGKIMALHSSMILRFLLEYINTKTVQGICAIPMDYTLHKGDKTCGLKITNSHNIQYNKSVSNSSDTSSVYSIEKNDVIVAINGCRITSDGNMYCPNINMNISPSIYIALNFYKNQPLKISLIRKKKLEQTIINARLLNTMTKISYNVNNNFISHNGFIFVELTENILINYDLTLSSVTGECIDIYQKNNYTNNYNIKVIALVHIDKLNLTEKKLNEVNNLGLPIINNASDGSYSIPILKKINNQPVENLHHLQNLLCDAATNSVKFQFKATTTNTFTILFEHKNI